MASEEHCVKALDQHEKKLSENPQIQGLGVVSGEGEPFDSENCAVAVYVDKKVPQEELPDEHHLPDSLEIEYEGNRHRVPVRVIEQGPVTLEGPGLEDGAGAVPGLEELGPETPGIEPGLAPEKDAEE